MSHDFDPDDTATRRGKRDRINRLRERLARAKAFKSHDDLCAVLAGVLDLLGDEL
jgi:hypothetical protein